jgi:DNA modification methylase
MSRIETIAEGITLHPGDCLDVLAAMADASVDSCVCDPPYGLKFMGRAWDHGVPGIPYWAHVLRVLKPGGHLLAFSGTRTYHRMVCAIEDAGFEIRDQIGWAYGSGFPKSHDVSKGIDRAAGAEREVIGKRQFANGTFARDGAVMGQHGVYGPATGNPMVTAPATDDAAQWQGWGTALKPAWEPVVMARKPLGENTVAANVLKHGTGAINIDGCRVDASDADLTSVQNCRTEQGGHTVTLNIPGHSQPTYNTKGRWPANIVHDGSDEVVGAFPETAAGTIGVRDPNGTMGYHGGASGLPNVFSGHADNGGSAARFFYQVKRDEECHSIRFASDAEARFDLKSERVVSALSHAVEASMPQSELQNLSYRAPDMSVSERELRIVCASVTEAIQNLGRRSWLGLEQESTTVRLGPAICVATQRPTGITTITLSLWRSARSVEAVTFNIIETSAEAGASVSGKRLFYTAKADADDRLGSKHPTVKPLDLMQWLVRLVTPPGGTVLDPFAGTGTTGEAAFREGFRAVLIEREPEYQNDIRRRMSLVLGGPDERRRESIKASGKAEGAGPLFEGIA